MNESTQSTQSRGPDSSPRLLGCIGGIALLLVLVFLTRRLGLGTGSIWIALCGLALANALLLKMGKVKPGGWFWGGQSPLGMALMGIGVLGFGFGDMGSPDPPSSPAEAVFLILALCVPVGLVIEARARRRKKAGAEEGSEE